MEIVFTKQAQDYLNDFLNEENILVLTYDIEDCGCAVNGVPLLRIEPAAEVKSDLVRITTNKFPLFMLQKQTLFFDDNMQVHYENNHLKLSSKNQIFTSNLALKRIENL